MRNLFAPNLNNRPRKVNQKALVIIIALLVIIWMLSLTSCVTQNACNRKFPPQAFTHDSIIIKDSIVFIPDTFYIAGNDIIMRDTLPCPELNYHRSSTKNNLTSTVDIKNGVLTSECKSDSLMKVIQNQLRTINTLRDRKQLEVKTVEVYLTHWYTFVAYWLAIILLLVLAFFIGSKVIAKR